VSSRPGETILHGASADSLSAIVAHGPPASGVLATIPLPDLCRNAAAPSGSTPQGGFANLTVSGADSSSPSCTTHPPPGIEPRLRRCRAVSLLNVEVVEISPPALRLFDRGECGMRLVESLVEVDSHTAASADPAPLSNQRHIAEQARFCRKVIKPRHVPCWIETAQDAECLDRMCMPQHRSGFQPGPTSSMNRFGPTDS